MKKIRKGHTGEAVLIWQGIVGVGESGLFDEETESATMAWQRVRGLEPDGIVGARSWGAAGFAGEKRVDTVRTPISEHDYLVALLKECSELTKEGALCVLSQYLTETGARACFNFNIGNTKDHDQDGYDYFCLNGVWEGFSPEVAAGYIARGEAVPDVNAATNGHAAAVGPGKVSIIFPPPHPMSRFRAYPDLRASMRHHLSMLQTYYKAAWSSILQGKPRETAIGLKANGYYTASEKKYGDNMVSFWNARMASDAYERARAAIEQDDTSTLPGLPEAPPTQPEITNAASTPTTAPEPVVHARIFDEEWTRPINLDDDEEVG